MDNLIIAKTKETPSINFNSENKLYIIEGRSLPENAATFFEPLLKWLKENLDENAEKITFEFKLEYFNSASSKQIFILLLFLNDFHSSKNNVQINWYFDEDDELIEEEGKEFEEMLTLPFQFFTIY